MDAARRLLILAAAVLVAFVPTSLAAELKTPRSGEVFFGAIRARAPAGATHAKLFLDGRLLATRDLRRRCVAFRLRHPPGRYDVRIRFERDGRLLRRDAADRVWLLPRGAQSARRERGRDAALSARLGSLGRSFAGYSAFWMHDLRTGRTAGWNSDASFPAASTVKLGVLVAALDRFGPNPERSRAWSLIRDVAVWSSNHASNRLLILLGGSEAGGARVAQERLHRMGAASSTFTGNYRLGTSRGDARGDAPRPLPFLTYRRTTAHDLGRILFELHAAAAGNRLSLRRTGLTRHEASLGLGLLLSSDPHGANLGLFRPWVDRGLPMAQKQGWTTYLRHTAAVVYGRGGPKIVVLLTYRQRLPRSQAAALGRRVVDALEL